MRPHDATTVTLRVNDCVISNMLLYQVREKLARIMAKNIPNVQMHNEPCRKVQPTEPRKRNKHIFIVFVFTHSACFVWDLETKSNRNVSDIISKYTILETPRAIGNCVPISQRRRIEGRILECHEE